MLPASDLDCPRCYPMTVEICEDEIEFNFGLSPNTDYTVMFEDMFGNHFEQDITTDADGDFIIDTTTADFPEGTFATGRNLSIVIVTPYVIVETFLVNYIEYDSICFKIDDNSDLR